MKERRETQRIPIEDCWITVTVQDSNLDKDLQRHNQPVTRQVRIANQSSGGLCIISDKPFDLGQHVISEDQSYRFNGVVVWTCQSRLECKAGIQYLDL